MDVFQRLSAQRATLLPRRGRTTRDNHYFHRIAFVHRKIAQGNHPILSTRGLNVKRLHKENDDGSWAL